ncbi:MAG TPA: Mu-like prophage major head subunit gpT family protein [Gaiellaceae bacterium]|jgi:phage major head subunit gpT-like protein|nr:Mu-like prophage major head subunit gpT family protein [Gaiellaceae bacterium]
MSIITQARLDALRTSLSLIYMEAYRSATYDWSRFAKEVPSDSTSTVYGWLAQQLTLSEWKGKRTRQNLAEHVHEIVNRPFEGTVDIDRDKLEDDKLDIYRTQHIPQLGVATAKWPDILIADLMMNNAQPGPDPTKGMTWDGVPLYDTAHPNFNVTGKGATSYKNEYASTPLNADNLMKVRAEARSIVGEDGRPLKANPRLLVVNPTLEKTALELCTAPLIAQIAQNVAGDQNVAASAPTNIIPQTGIVPFVWDYLAGFDDLWFLLDVDRPVMPFANQIRRAPEFISRTRADDPIVFDERKYVFGVDYRGEVYPTLPWLQFRAYASATAPEDR